MPETNTPRYRYPGTRPFNADDSYIFMGRGEDIDNLVQKMHIQKLLVLYSRSGLGKSSLINAKLTAALAAEEGVMPVVVRLGAYVKGTTSPLQKFTELLHARFPEAGQSILFTQLFKTEQPTTHALWYLVKSIQVSNPAMLNFILIFDQFEELFTYPDEMVREFGKALAEMFFVSVPQQLRTKMNAIRLTPDDLDEDTRKLLGSPVAIKLLMAIRSDKMSLLNNLASYFPSILQNCYELRALNREQATEAIIQPAALPGSFVSPAFTYSPEAISLILDGLTKVEDETAPGRQAEIETFQLQIVCKYAENLVITQKINRIEAADLGEINTIFENHYRNIIAGLPEDERLPARRLLEEKLIVDGIRISMPKVSILKEPGMTEKLLGDLVETHILRPEQDNYFEIAHDTLVFPIMRYYDERKLEELKINELKQLEEKSQAEKAALEKQLAEQAERNRVRKRRIQRTALLCILAFLGVFTVVLLRQNEAIKARGVAFSLFSQALVKVRTDPTDALGLACKALEKSDDSTIVNGSFEILAASTFYKTTIKVSENSYIQILSDDSTVLTGSSTGMDTLWTREGKMLQTFKTSNKIRSADISKDGKYIVIGDIAGTVALYNRDGSFKRNITQEPASVTTARFSKDGQNILVRSEENSEFNEPGVVKLFSIKGEKQQVLGHGVCAEFSANAQYIFVGTNYGEVVIYTNSGKKLRSIELYNGMIQTICSTDDMLLVASWNGILSYWFSEDGRFEKIKKTGSTINNEDACPAAFIVPGFREADGNSIALFTGSYRGEINPWVYRGESGFQKDISYQGPGMTKSIALNKQTDVLYTCFSTGVVVSWTQGLGYIIKRFDPGGKSNLYDIFSKAQQELTKEEKVDYLRDFYKKLSEGSPATKIKSD